MDKKKSALYSEYIIDGVLQELTPARMLDACLLDRSQAELCPASDFEPVVDETTDPDVRPIVTDKDKLKSYLRQVKDIKHRTFPKSFPEAYTKARIAKCLIDAIWKGGHFRLGDLALQLGWRWSPDHIGDMACFYSSVSSAADYIDMLGLRVSQYSYEELETGTEFDVKACIASAVPDEEEEQTEFFDELPFRTEHPSLKARNMHPTKLVDDPQSWLIYVPFEQCDYRLGASALAQALGISGAVAPQILDADYFIDCYEVVRELVEDGIILSGTTVGDGGIISALKSMASPKAGASIELADLVNATGEKDIVKLLFAEVPGVIFQISDIDYDYVDAELLLQDVAFYPLGHPISGSSEVRVSSSEKSGIQIILESIIRSQNSEGED